MVRRARRYLRNHRKPIRLGLAAAGVLVGLGVVWILITGLLARQAAQDLENRLQAVRGQLAEGHLGEAQRLASEIPTLGNRAHRLTTGPAWWVGAQLPFVGEPLVVVRGTMGAGAHAADIVPDLMKVVTKLDPGRLRTDGHTLKLAPLEQAAPPLERASRAIGSVADELATLPGSTWLGPVDSGRDRVAVDIQLIRGYVDAAARVAQVLPTMLGQDRPQTYFIGLQNEAEMRGTGGLPGAFAIARASGGTLRFEHFYSDAELLPPGPKHIIETGLDFGPDYDAAYGST